jgi:hypothetical protein
MTVNRIGPNGGRLQREPASGPFVELVAGLVGLNPQVLGTNNLQTVLELLAAGSSVGMVQSEIDSQAMPTGGAAVLTGSELVQTAVAGQFLVVHAELQVNWANLNDLQVEVWWDGPAGVMVQAWQGANITRTFGAEGATQGYSVLTTLEFEGGFTSPFNVELRAQSANVGAELETGWITMVRY